MKIDNKEEFIKYKMDYLANLLAENMYPLVGDDRKEVALAMERIVDAGNSFILKDYYLHYFAYEALTQYLLGKDISRLLSILKNFESKNEDELYDSIIVMYSSIYSCCKWWKNYEVTDGLRRVFANYSIPLIKEAEEVDCSIMESKYTNYTVFYTIINCIKAYCVINEKPDAFMGYADLLLNDKEALLDDLLFHDLIFEETMTDPSRFRYLELRKYVRYRLDNCDIERKELK